MSEFSFRRTWGPSPKYPLVQAYEHPHKEFTIIAGPCAVESTEQIETIATYVAPFATHLRGGVFRAGTYPGKSFGWIERDIIFSYWNAAKTHGLQNIIEVLDYRDLGFLDQYAMCYQVGCRQMQNYTLLRELGKTKKPVLLKRHPGATIDEFLGAAEHLLAGGVTELYLIERGSSTNATHVRWDLSISMIPAVKKITKIPILVDGSHGTGRRDLVEPMTLAGVAAGADGCLVECHIDPENSLSDSDQAISVQDWQSLMIKTKTLLRSR